jgi:hypothetical protein
MEKHPASELDRLLSAMINSADGISDLLFVAGQPPQVEAHGVLEPAALAHLRADSQQRAH